MKKTELRHKDLTLDIITCAGKRSGREFKLTQREFQMLALFMTDPEHLFTRDEISKKIWRGELKTYSNTIDVYVAYLRKKLNAFGEPALLKGVRGEGYVLDKAA